MIHDPSYGFDVHKISKPHKRLKSGKVAVSHIHQGRWFVVLLSHYAVSETFPPAFPCARVVVSKPETRAHQQCESSFLSLLGWNSFTRPSPVLPTIGRFNSSHKYLKIRERVFRGWRCRNFKSACHKRSRTASVNISHLPPYPSHTHIRSAIHDNQEWSKQITICIQLHTPVYTTAGGET
jgi:hypothetical protein